MVVRKGGGKGGRWEAEGASFGGGGGLIGRETKRDARALHNKQNNVRAKNLTSSSRRMCGCDSAIEANTTRDFCPPESLTMGVRWWLPLRPKRPSIARIFVCVCVSPRVFRLRFCFVLRFVFLVGVCWVCGCGAGVVRLVLTRKRHAPTQDI